MKKTVFNETHIEGLLYEHKLELKVSGEKSKNPGTEFISGNIFIATDDAGLNVIPVHFTYVTAVTKNGGPNNTFNALKRILDGAPCVTKDGKDKAIMVRCDSAIGLNEFYSDRNGESELVSAKRNEGGFVHIVTDKLDEDEKNRATFSADMLITGTRDVEENPDRGTPAKLILKGYIFDFRKALLPVEFSVLNANGMKYFGNLDCSERRPVFTKVWGRQISQTTYREVVEESAFGDASVKMVPSSNKDFVVTGTAKVPYLWDDEDGITAIELTEALQSREVYLATVKKNQEEWQNSRKNTSPVASVNTADGPYNF